ncbi:MAG: hypothetical protein AAB538_05825 [Patescibacteria group bacterium]
MKNYLIIAIVMGVVAALVATVKAEEPVKGACYPLDDGASGDKCIETTREKCSEEMGIREEPPKWFIRNYIFEPGKTCPPAAFTIKVIKASAEGTTKAAAPICDPAKKIPTAEGQKQCREKLKKYIFSPEAAKLCKADEFLSEPLEDVITWAEVTPVGDSVYACTVHCRAIAFCVPRSLIVSSPQPSSNPTASATPSTPAPAS